ncbi:MAG: chemotaxis protein CheW [Thermodesulfobacteriota bacterium]
MPQDTEELIGEVTTECLEHVGQMETLLLSLEESAGQPDPEIINSIFRSAHSIKGVTAFCGLNKIRDLAHAFENVLNAVRQGALQPSTILIDMLLKANDFLKGMLENAEQSESYDIEPFVNQLNSWLEVKSETGGPGLTARKPTLTDNLGRWSFEIEEGVLEDKKTRGHHLYILTIDPASQLPDQAANPLEFFEQLHSFGEVLETSLPALPESDQALLLESVQEPLGVLFSSLLDPSVIGQALGLAPEYIEHHPWSGPEEVKAIVREVAATKLQPGPEPGLGQENGTAVPATKQPAAPAEALETEAHQAQYLRVNVLLLDKLMNLAGELVLGRNQLLQTTNELMLPTLLPVAQRINMITSELQADIMQTRMQPLEKVFGKFPRLVRDLSRALNKKVDLNIEGREVELDKTIVEALSDPLIHVIRNSLDHGIEEPRLRTAAGKKPEGQVNVRAYHEAGQVNIEISDDGAGINTMKLKEKAVRMGVISQAEAQGLSEQAAIELIFRPGLSTAEQVSDVSGRGVGMDVVRSNLEKLGGVLDVKTAVGQGSTFRIKLPLTMAIIPCLIVRLGRERYAVPQINLIELVRVRRLEIRERIERVGGAEVLRLRENLLPLVRLTETLNTTGQFRDPLSGELRPDRRATVADRRSEQTPEEAAKWREQRRGEDRRQAMDALNILVLSAGDLEYGLIVDELQDTEEIVVKPLGRHLKEIPSYAGATIMGDGLVAPILDVLGLAQQAELHRKEEATREAAAARAKEMEALARKDMEKVLLFKHGPTEHFAVPIPLVARIERIITQNIETALGRLSIQYRGGSLRLIKMDQHLPVEPLPPAEKLFVIVFEIAGKEIGLPASVLVDEKLVPFELDTHTHQHPGIMGSMIIDGRTVMVLDIFELVELEDPEWVAREKKAESSPVRILLVEDSDFFLKKVAGYLREAGFEVFTATNGQEGLEVLEKQTVDVVLTDIDMPVMNGYEFVRRIRTNPRLAGMTVMALSSMAGDDDIKRGIAAGVDKYLIKLDREILINTLFEYCHRA